VTDRRAVSQLRRLMTWLEAFKICFGHRAQVLAVRRYVQGHLTSSIALVVRCTDIQLIS
jgi:hypothetical protein